MSVECTSCGHLIPAGQFRCGKCGGLAPRESLEDFGGLTEVVADSPTSAPPAGPPALVLMTQEPPAPSAAAEPPEPPAQPVAEPVVEPVFEVEAAHARDLAVPKGTFASEIPQPSPPPPRPADHSGELRAVAREAADAAALPGSASTSAQRIKEARAAPRPPFLASEILREDLTPLEPGKRTLAHVTQVAGGAGFVGTLLFGYDSFFGLLCAALCAALVVLGRVRLEYTARTIAVAGVAGAGLAIASLVRLSLGASQDDPMLAAACALLPAALLFRAWYRAAQMARVLVGASLVFALAWAAMTSHRGLLTLAFTWQSWLPALAWYVFGILCLLSLLAFMGDETTGGCDAWALGLLTWFSLYACLRAALEAQAFAAASRAAAAALSLAEPACAAPLAVALAQLYARAPAARRRAAVARS